MFRKCIHNDIPKNNLYDLIIDYRQLEKIVDTDFQKLVVSILRRLLVMLVGTPSLNHSIEEIEAFRNRDRGMLSEDN